VVEEPGPDLRVDGGILDGRVGEDQRVGVDPLGRIGGDIGDQVAVGIGIPVTQRELSLRRQRDTQRRKSHKTLKDIHGFPPCLDYGPDDRRAFVTKI
jgi:hypothetical protein